MTDEEIDTSDIPPLDDAFFANAQLRLPEGNVSVVMNVDDDPPGSLAVDEKR